ncbi:MAG: WXG100 family type VII secretion target [Nocardioides sp.]|nr:WXG100 family type VII secretion target [Nocardioides sp.]
MVAEAKGDFDNISKTLMGNVEQLKSQWGGQGFRAFDTLSQEWQAKQNKILSALNVFESNLQTTEKDNVATDESQSSTMASISAGLDAAPGV